METSLFRYLITFFPALIIFSLCNLSNLIKTMTSLENHGENGKLFARNCYQWLKNMPMSCREKVVELVKTTKKIGEDDPRRIIYSIKLGLALTLVSLFYYVRPLFDSVGISAIWAVMTVIVVFQFSVGSTIGKAFNRGLATLLAGALGFGVHKLANFFGSTAEPILLGFFVFIQATATTFIRFFPKIKAKYDYGMLIFVLTFSMVAVSSFRDDEVFTMVHKRLSTILIGAAACVVVSVSIFPVWAGQELHDLVALNIDKLGNFLEGFGDEYFNKRENEDPKKDKSFLKEYKSVLNSKDKEESLANDAWWEPAHGSFIFRHPWKQYLKIGNLTRECAYRIEALNSHLNSKIKTPEEFRCKIKEWCLVVSFESGKAMKELSCTMKTMTKPSTTNPQISKLKEASENLKSLLKSDMWRVTDLLELVPLATLTSLLIDVASCVEEIADSVQVLSELAHFRSKSNLKVSPVPEKEGHQGDKTNEADHIITLDELLKTAR